MIKSFADSDTAALYAGREVRRFRGYRIQAERRLAILRNAKRLGDLAGLRSNRLEALSGGRAGQYSIRVNRQYRVCFRWFDNNAYDVEIVDYHR
ncbi:MAG TPA: type II toxin-antitoxin system RelE/ParE family toxin [Alphaproteobacteria bacterium]|nr:type II toxin-antitoxin system RelE/ParE family toxin [Alphaproteobacteria bacterium]